MNSNYDDITVTSIINIIHGILQLKESSKEQLSIMPERTSC